MSEVKNNENSTHPDIPAKLSDPSVGPDILDWDACIEVAPLRPTKTIKVRLHYQGRDKRLPLEGPQDEKAQTES